MEQIDCFSRKRNIPDLDLGPGSAPFGALPAGRARTDEWAGLNPSQLAGKHGKQRETAVFLGKVRFILFKGQKSGKSNGIPLSRQSREGRRNCRLGTPEPAGTRKREGNRGKQLFSVLFLGFRRPHASVLREGDEKQPKGCFSQRKVNFILFKGLKSGKSNGFRPSAGTGQLLPKCRLGPSDSAGIRETAENNGKQLFPLFSGQVPLAAFAG